MAELPPVHDRSEIPQIVPVEFRLDHEPDPKTGDMKVVEWVSWAKKGSGLGVHADITEDKVARVQKHNPAVWKVLAPYYDAWKKGEEEPVDGTPIEVVSFFTKYQVQHLKSLHIRTVEDVAGLSEGDLPKIGMGAMELRRKAQAFIQSKQGDGKIAVLMAAKDEQLDAMKAQIAELMSTVKGLGGQVTEGSVPTATKPKASPTKTKPKAAEAA